MRLVKRLSGISVALLIAFPISAAAQTSVGFRGGVTFSSVAFDGTFGSSIRAGASGGGFVELPFSNRAAVQIEGLYIRRGFSTVGFLVEGSSARVGYIDLPVLVKFRLTETAARVRPSVMAGGYWGFEVSCQTGGGIVDVEESTSCDGRFRGRGTADVGVILGGSVDVGVSERLFLVVDGRYAIGLRNLHWEPESDRNASRAWTVMGGFGFRLGS